jgi:acetyl esterase
MPLDPQARKFLDLLATLDVPELGTVPVERSRREGAQRRAAMPPGPAALVSDHLLARPNGERLLRLYKPLDAVAPLPVLIWFHGGGWVLGSVIESDAECRHLTVRSGCAVVSVDYSLSPEHPHPTALHEAYAALEWVHANAPRLGLDPARVAIGGDSAGGNLAACTARLARDRKGPPLAYQLLIYPVTDITTFDRPSHLENADGYFLTRDTMQWFSDQYVPTVADRADPNVSPLHAPDLSGLPPAFVATAEFDPLRDEGEAYAKRLTEAGVPVSYKQYLGMIHGCFSMHSYLDGGKRLLADAAAALRERLQP